MTDKKTEKPKDRFQQEFEALPLEEKFAKLFQMETATFSEAFTYAVNSPMKVVEKVGDVITEFGIKIENEVKKAAASHKAESKTGEPKASTAKPKARPTRKSTAPRAPKA